ncbi:hypothetical protein [Salmonella phage BPSELC-1]|uniref:Uncharacterized protein n=3 Tax=Felixounavirus TaxID=1198140 RepID=A0A6G5V637_9CAUD|nr:hypothetical protein BPS15S6_110 [Salmonella phage BPS15S6]QEP52922.1 hypothetical protein [Salmonella phage BPSELC-1]UGV20119.1 hypothetical protein ph22_0103 [Salmonella phage ph2-2]
MLRESLRGKGNDKKREVVFVNNHCDHVNSLLKRLNTC